ncbi:Metal homeostatis protein BSD2 [Nakaseomyces bracarensis]|uniref:Metal homeostatis protein BSD2 n=1 Tax=Nakaseomyces bracarensis TaxID=273131 RepID=A0ABR4NMC7_9SACH
MSEREGDREELEMVADVGHVEAEPTEVEEGSSDRLLPGVRERAARHIDTIGRHFNVLDRLFKRRSNNNDGGAGFDGVFSNLSAKPDANSNQEITQQDHPPTYDEAAADMSPSYYGMDLSSTDMYYDEICIEGLPVGNIANLLWNIIVSTSFQFVGFLVTYLLHTSHAAKQGSRFGLGLTFIGYAYSMLPRNVDTKVGKDKTASRVKVENPNDFDDLQLPQDNVPTDDFESKLSHGLEEKKQSLSFLAIFSGLLGFFIAVKSIYDYVKVKRMEKKYLSQDDHPQQQV